MRRLGFVLLLLPGMAAVAAQMSFDFSRTPEGGVPDGFTPILAGEGRTGRWEVVMAAVPPLLAPLSPQAPQTAVKAVLTQTDPDPTDERFPMLVYDREEFGDFTLKTRFRILGGQKEQMAGIAFRLQDWENFYVIRASALGQNIRFYKVVEGIRGRLIGPSLPIRTNQWEELTIQCEGNEVTCALNGELVMPPLQDSSFAKGKIAFWTKSDSLCQFAGATIRYTPTVPLSVQVVEAALEEYPRVLDLRLYAFANQGDTTQVIACKHPEDLGSNGSEAEAKAIRNADIYFGKNKKIARVVMPVRDRNGDPVAAARIEMKSFPGQTENNAIVRARPIVRLMEQRIQSSETPFQ